MGNITTIEGLEHLNTSEVKLMDQMFNGLENITSLNLSHFDTKNVISMNEMFKECRSLTSLDLSNFDTSNVLDLGTMFQGCSSLTSVNLKGFNTAKVRKTSNMFSGCASLTSLDLSSFNTANVTKMNYMFSGCNKLEYILIGDGWNTDNVSKSDGMFSYCSSLVGQYGNWVIAVTDKTFANAGEDGYMRSTLPVETTKKGYACYDGAGTLTFRYDEKMPAQNAWVATDTRSNCPWGDINSQVTKVVIEPSFANARPNSCAGWFAMSRLASMEGLQYLNTSNVRSMSGMFWNCTLTSIDLSNFNTSKVQDMDRMFYGSKFNTLNLDNFSAASLYKADCMCGACKATYISMANFNTEKVTNMSLMFHLCTNLKRLNLAGLNTKNVTNMWRMFENCSAVEYILIGPDWQTDAVTNSYGMFGWCTSLTGQDGTTVGDIDDKTFAHAGAGGYLREADMKMYAAYDGAGTLRFCYDKNMPAENAWEVDDTQEVPAWQQLSTEITSVVIAPSFAQARPRSCIRWFCNMPNLPHISGLRYLNTSWMTSMMFMFTGCSSLTELDLTHFETGNVTDMSLMFKGCSSLRELDLSSFDTWFVTTTSGMFWDCGNLESIYIGDRWNLWRVTTYASGDMFTGCTSLVGEDGTTVGDKTDKRYAHANEHGYMKKKKATGVKTVVKDKCASGSWYDMYGRRLAEKPSTPGVYINNGHKYTIK